MKEQCSLFDIKIPAYPLLILMSVLALTACGSSSGGSTTASVTLPAASSTSSSSSSSSAGSVGCLTSPDLGHGGVPTMSGFYVADGKLYDGTDHEFIMRGVNYPYAWFKDQQATTEKFADIASTCSNTVRVVLSNGEQWERNTGAEVAAIIAAAKNHNLVVMLEVHDVTGYGQNSSAAAPQTAVDYWLSEDIRTAIEGEEGYVLINIANEAFGNAAAEQEDRQIWLDFYSAAIVELRDAGLSHTLVVDAPNWGQDSSHSMRDGTAAQTIFDSDINKNVVFSVHMYDVYDTSAEVETYLQKFVDRQLPLIVGEFAADHGADKNVDEAAILLYAKNLDIGYLGWSWSGNGDGLSSLDIVNNFNINTLSSWGETLINGTNGIRETSAMCKCYETLVVE